MPVGIDMYSYYTTTYLSKTIHIIKGQSDSAENIQISILANRYDSSDPLKLASDYNDSYLESNGWTKIGVINGGLFFTSGSYVYANGIEKAYGTINENDDSSLDSVMSLSHDYSNSNTTIIQTQSSAKANLDSYRGSITGAFGLLRNGSVDQGNTSAQGAYSSLSGRSIVGKDSSGAIYFISTPGVTGSSGLTGSQCVSLAQSLGLTDAIAMDGGGSVSLIYQGSWKVSTTREIKNVVAMYVKQIGGGGGGGTTTIPQTADKYIPIFKKEYPYFIKNNNNLINIVDIKQKNGSELISINDIEIKN